jgi:biopolymer transport protein ExbD
MKTFRHAALAHDSAHGIDLAPMLDFVMNLLIFFIITAIFIKQAGIEVARPTGEGEGGASLSIRVMENDEVMIGDRVVEMRAIRANVERERAAQADIAVTLMASNGASTGAVLGVVDQVRLGGLEDITFVTAAEE